MLVGQAWSYVTHLLISILKRLSRQDSFSVYIPKLLKKCQLFLLRKDYASADSVLVLLELASLKFQVIITMEM